MCIRDRRSSSARQRTKESSRSFDILFSISFLLSAVSLSVPASRTIMRVFYKQKKGRQSVPFCHVILLCNVLAVSHQDGCGLRCV